MDDPLLQHKSRIFSVVKTLLTFSTVQDLTDGDRQSSLCKLLRSAFSLKETHAT